MSCALHHGAMLRRTFTTFSYDYTLSAFSLWQNQDPTMIPSNACQIMQFLRSSSGSNNQFECADPFDHNNWEQYLECEAEYANELRANRYAKNKIISLDPSPAIPTDSKISCCLNRDRNSTNQQITPIESHWNWRQKKEPISECPTWIGFSKQTYSTCV